MREEWRARRCPVLFLTGVFATVSIGLAPGWTTVGLAGADGSNAETRPASRPALDIPADFARALQMAWKKVDDLKELVNRRGIVPGFGRRAQQIVQTALIEANAQGSSAESLELVLDAPLRALFQQQLHSLVLRCADIYEAEVTARPNPLEAKQTAEAKFLNSASDLVRPGSDWDFEPEHQDLLQLVHESFGRDSQIVQEQVKQGRGKQIAIEVIRKLQEQQAAVQREVETRGAFPWNVKWQYMVDNTPVGFRGQYSQGRSIVELLLMPSPDPRYKNNILNRIGPLNLAVAFDMLM